MCYNLPGAALPDGKPISPDANPSLFIQRFLRKISLLLSKFEGFYLQIWKFIGSPQKSCFLPGRELPALAWAKYALLVQQGKKHKLSWQHPGTHFWQLWEAHASLLDFHFHVPTVSTAGSGFLSQPSPTWHWISGQTSEPGHLTTCLQELLQDNM